MKAKELKERLSKIKYPRMPKRPELPSPFKPSSYYKIYAEDLSVYEKEYAEYKSEMAVVEKERDDLISEWDKTLLSESRLNDTQHALIFSFINKHIGTASFEEQEEIYEDLVILHDNLRKS